MCQRSYWTHWKAQQEFFHNITVVEGIRDIPATKVRAVSRSLVILFLCLFLSDDDGGGDGDGGSDEQKKEESGGEELEAGRRLAEQRLAKEQGSSLISYWGGGGKTNNNLFHNIVLPHIYAKSEVIVNLFWLAMNVNFEFMTWANDKWQWS